MNRRSLAIAILVVLLLAIPLVVTSTYHMRIVNLALVFGLLAVSLNIVLGYTGQVALGHSGFFGIGAYTAALITEGGSGLLFWPGFLAAGIVTGIAGLAIGIPALRLRGHYLALATLGFGEIMRHVFFNWREVTRGMDGISGIPAPSIGIVELQGEGSYFYLALAILALAVLFCWRLQASKYG
ncbi:MAG: branched-chain amino acid ABC transporter permease, partial [Azospirillaceae bacterium]